MLMVLAAQVVCLIIIDFIDIVATRRCSLTGDPKNTNARLDARFGSLMLGEVSVPSPECTFDGRASGYARERKPRYLKIDV